MEEYLDFIQLLKIFKPYKTIVNWFKYLIIISISIGNPDLLIFINSFLYYFILFIFFIFRH